jgi:hypothetical protein
VGTAVGSKVGMLVVSGGFILIGLSPLGPVAGGLFAAIMGAGIAAGSAMATLQALAMTTAAYTTGAAVGGAAGAAMGAKTGGNMTYFVIDKARNIIHFFNGTFSNEDTAEYFPDSENVTVEEFHRFLLSFPGNSSNFSESSVQSNVSFVEEILAMFNTTYFSLNFTGFPTALGVNMKENITDFLAGKAQSIYDFMNETLSENSFVKEKVADFSDKMYQTSKVLKKTTSDLKKKIIKSSVKKKLVKNLSSVFKRASSYLDEMLKN